jgi:hypothetical protein
MLFAFKTPSQLNNKEWKFGTTLLEVIKQQKNWHVYVSFVSISPHGLFAISIIVHEACFFQNSIIVYHNLISSISFSSFQVL